MKRIAIIGGGPAGAMAAERLARDGAAAWGKVSVTVFEEKLAWEKPCGGALTWKALRHYPFLKESCHAHRRVDEAELIAPNGKSVRFSLRLPLDIYSRSTLDNLLLDRARQAGAEIVPDRIHSLTPRSSGWQLGGRKSAYPTDYLVLAAGARTRLRSLLCDDFSQRDFMLTYGYYVPTLDTTLRVRFYEDFEGYAWSFPRPDHLSVGICGKVGKCGMRDLRERLGGFMTGMGYSSEGARVFSHLLPSLSIESLSSMRLAGRDWALAGDAAGLVDPLTGEGIYYAMRSGELLAESLLDGSPDQYAARVKQEFGLQMITAARLGPHFFRGHLLGEPVTARLVELAAYSRTSMDLLQDLVAGLQSYPDLVLRVYRDLWISFVEMALGSLAGSLRRPHPASGN